MRKGKTITALMLILALCMPQLTALAWSEPTVTGQDYELQAYPDFSEMNVASGTSRDAENGFVRGVGDGGNALYALAYMARWDGPCAESDDPYAADNYSGKVKAADSAVHLQEALFFPHREQQIKQAVVRYGAATLELHSTSDPDDRFWMNDPEKEIASFYVPAKEDNAPGAHLVAVVGWDDDYPRENFKITPPVDGAFLCKNSWGSDWGADGFFYVSYATSTLNELHLVSWIKGHFAQTHVSDSTVFRARDGEDPYNKIYQYDPLGVSASLSRLYGKIRYTANVFPQQGKTLEADEELRAFSFYTLSDNVRYTAYFVDNAENEEQMRDRIARGDCLMQTGTVANAGYHVIDLDTPLPLRAGTRFAVAVTVSDDRYACETRIAGYSDNAKAAVGESYYGASGKLFDLNRELENCNWCIKAFTQYTPEAEPDAQRGRVFFGVPESQRSYTLQRAYDARTMRDLGFEISDAFAAFMGKADRSDALIPSPLVLSHEQAADPSLPSQYDLRDYGYVTTVKNQSPWETCWVFASIASLESTMLRAYAGQNSLWPDAAALQTAAPETADVPPGGSVWQYQAETTEMHTITVSSDSPVRAQLCSPYGVVLEEKTGVRISLHRFTGAGETFCLRILPTSGDTRRITVSVTSALSAMLEDEAGIVTLSANETSAQTLPAMEGRVFRFTNETQERAAILVNRGNPDTLRVWAVWGDPDAEISEMDCVDLDPCETVCLAVFNVGKAECDFSVSTTGGAAMPPLPDGLDWDGAVQLSEDSSLSVSVVPGGAAYRVASSAEYVCVCIRAPREICCAINSDFGILRKTICRYGEAAYFWFNAGESFALWSTDDEVPCTVRCAESYESLAVSCAQDAAEGETVQVPPDGVTPLRFVPQTDGRYAVCSDKSDIYTEFYNAQMENLNDVCPEDSTLPFRSLRKGEVYYLMLWNTNQQSIRSAQIERLKDTPHSEPVSLTSGVWLNLNSAEDSIFYTFTAPEGGMYRCVFDQQTDGWEESTFWTAEISDDAETWTSVTAEPSCTDNTEDALFMLAAGEHLRVHVFSTAETEDDFVRSLLRVCIRRDETFSDPAQCPLLSADEPTSLGQTGGEVMFRIEPQQDGVYGIAAARALVLLLADSAGKTVPLTAVHSLRSDATIVSASLRAGESYALVLDAWSSEASVELIAPRSENVRIPTGDIARYLQNSDEALGERVILNEEAPVCFTAGKRRSWFPIRFGFFLLYSAVDNRLVSVKTQHTLWARGIDLGGTNGCHRSIILYCCFSGQEPTFCMTAQERTECTAATLDFTGVIGILNGGTTTVRICAGSSQKLPYSGVDRDLLTWSSSDESVVTVRADGRIRAVSPGAAKVYAESPDGAVRIYTVYVYTAWETLLRYAFFGWLYL